MKITTGIASTTHIDKHNERMTKTALDDMAIQINKKFIPQLIEHDPNQQSGVILYGKVFQLEDGEYALGFVSGIFENNKEKETFIIGHPNNVWREYKKYFDITELLLPSRKSQKTKNQTKHKSPNLNIADLLETHLNSTRVMPDGTVIKIKRFIASTGDLKIEVYPKDHTPQHFHVISKQRNINARFDIVTLNLISTKKGSIKNNDIKRIKNLFSTNPIALKKLISEHTRLNDI